MLPKGCLRSSPGLQPTRHHCLRRRGWGRRGVPITRSAAPSPGPHDRSRRIIDGLARYDRLDGFAADRPEQPLHEGMLLVAEGHGIDLG